MFDDYGNEIKAVAKLSTAVLNDMRARVHSSTNGNLVNLCVCLLAIFGKVD